MFVFTHASQMSASEGISHLFRAVNRLPVRNPTLRNSLPASACHIRYHGSATSAASSSHVLADRATVDEAEVRKFSALAASWWRDDGRGPFAPLHSLNALRVPLIRQALLDGQTTTRTSPATPHSPLLTGYRILDVGCGGGILSEGLGRLGATVTGIDASDANVAAASLHVSHDPDLAQRVCYRAVTVEAVAAEVAAAMASSASPGAAASADGRYDAVVASEVLEHVADRGKFLDSCAALVKVGLSRF